MTLCFRADAHVGYLVGVFLSGCAIARLWAASRHRRYYRMVEAVCRRGGAVENLTSTGRRP